MIFYTYMWLRWDGTPYYVGKGKGDRGFVSDTHCVKCPPKDRIIIQHHLTESDAFEAEIFLIAFFGRKDIGTGILRNRTNGGDGASGSIAHRGRKLTDEWKRKLAVAHMGLKPSEETRQKMSEAHKGQRHPNQILALEKHRGSRKGCIPWSKGRTDLGGYKLSPQTAEHRQKISDAKRGKRLSDEHRKKLSDAMRGKKRGPYKRRLA
jgi:hypothetical protein